MTPQRTPRTSSKPRSKLTRIANRCRQQQQTNSRRRQNDRLFPNVPSIFVGEIVCFIKHDEIGADFTSAT
jgi:hypothetical protein